MMLCEHTLYHPYFSSNMYVHGLGDAQEYESRRFDAQTAWLNEIKCECPKCKTQMAWEDYETDRYGDTTVYFYCETCDYTEEVVLWDD